MIGRLENHYILCGYGRIGIRIAQDLARARMPFVVIENDAEKIQLLEKSSLLFIEGNAEEESSLLNAGLLQAQGIILTLPDDSDNVFVTLTARELNPTLFIMARTDRRQNRRKLIRAGADKVIAPYEIGADRMAQVILRPHVDAFLERAFDTGALDLHMDEIVVQKGSLLDGKSLRSSQFRQRFEAIVVALVRADGSSTFNPDPSIEIRANDVLIAFGKPDMISRLRLEGCTPQ